jgi:hypothetical protein
MVFTSLSFVELSIAQPSVEVKRFGKNKKIKIFKKSLDKIAGAMV